MKEKTYPIVISTWKKAENQKVRILLDEYEGQLMIIARVWFRRDGVWRPSGHGLNLPADKHLSKLISGLKKARRMHSIAVI